VSSSVRKDPSWPDIQYTLNSFGIFDGVDEFLTNVFNVKRGLLSKYFWNEHTRNDRDANMVGVALVRPKSVGEITLASRNPYINPIIQPNYFSHKDDMKAMVDGKCNKIDTRISDFHTPFVDINFNFDGV